MEQAAVEFDLMAYLGKAVERLMADAVRQTLRNPRQSAFLVKFAAAAAAAARRRDEAEKRGEHVPPILIARAAGADTDGPLTGAEWESVFRQADELGFSFALLAGDPLARREALEAAAGKPNLLTLFFADGPELDAGAISLLDRHRNLLPLLRTGPGEEQAFPAMDGLRKRGLLFGALAQATEENAREAVSPAFARELQARGCRALLVLELPGSTGGETPELLREGVAHLRADIPEMIVVAYPGDAQSAGSLLAPGRGMVCVDARGGAAPGPFAEPAANLRDTSLREALKILCAE